MRGLLVNEDILLREKVISGEEISVPYNKFIHVMFKDADNKSPYFTGDVFTDISLIKNKENLYYNNKNGVYYYIWGKKENVSKTLYNCMKNRSIGRYLTFDLEYSCNNLLNRFNISAIKDREITDKLQSLLKYSFGLEFETSSGMIPEHLCYECGLIPLRDGSISGYEYSTIVLGKTYGLSLLKHQLEALKKYTEFDKECSLHIHFGKLPTNIRFAYILYKLCYMLEPAISDILPVYAFETKKFKKSRKDYCRKLEKFDTISQMYNYYAGTEELFVYEDSVDSVNLNISHPYDVNRSRKWNIHTRYHWVNFINLLFYKNHKTIEFRCLNPTRNFNKIVTWIYIFTAIINLAEIIYNQLKDKPLESFYKELCIILSDCINVSFPSIIVNVFDYDISSYKRTLMRSAINNLYTLKQKQLELRDYIGDRFELDNYICTTGFIK